MDMPESCDMCDFVDDEQPPRYGEKTLYSYGIEKGESYMCLTVKEVKEILDGMRDDALVLADKELEGDAAHELTAYEYPSGDKKDWNFVILTWKK